MSDAPLERRNLREDSAPREVVARYRFTAEELARAQGEHSEYAGATSARDLVPLLVLAAVLLAVFLPDDTLGVIRVIRLPTLVILAVVVVLRWGLSPLLRLLARRRFQTLSHADAEVTITLAEDGYRVAYDASELRSAWSQLEKVLSTSRGFLMYRTRTEFHWLPWSAFASREDAKRAEALLSERAPGYRTVF